MIKYKLHNVRKSRVSTAMVGGKRIILQIEEEKIISFTDYKKYEKSLESLKKSGIITCEKLMGAKAEKAKLSVDSIDKQAPDADATEKLRLAEEAEAKRLEEEAETKRLEEAEAKRLEEENANDANESNEGSEDETKANDSDDSSANDSSDASVPVVEAEKPQAPVQAPQNNQGGRNKRNRNRNK